MRTIAGRTLLTLLCGWILGLWCLTPARAFPIAPPLESLAGLTPGMNTVADAERLFGMYTTALPGDFSAYSGGPYASNAYRWTTGMEGVLPGLVVETALGSPTINCIVVDQYPGLATSHGLMALVSESRVTEIYGRPDFVFSISSPSADEEFHELYYIERGLLIVTGDEESRANLTVLRIILTYPTFLRNAIAARACYARNGLYIEDISESYATWAHMAYPNG